MTSLDVATTRGHFLYESGHHGDLWLDLDSLFHDPRGTHEWARGLAKRVMTCEPEVVCGPLTGGAFLAQALALELGVSFAHTERVEEAGGRVRYRIPDNLMARLEGKRVLVVDDAVNAASACRATVHALQHCGALTVGLACLFDLGEAAGILAESLDVELTAVAKLERNLWLPEECPQCQAGTQLEDRLGIRRD